MHSKVYPLPNCFVGAALSWRQISYVCISLLVWDHTKFKRSLNMQFYASWGVFFMKIVSYSYHVETFSINSSGCLKAVSKWFGCHIAFSNLDIMATIDPLQKLSWLSNSKCSGLVMFGVFSLQGRQMQEGTARFLMIITPVCHFCEHSPVACCNWSEFWLHLTSSVFPASENWISWYQLGHVLCAAAGLHMCCCEMWNQSRARPPLRNTGYKL